MSPLRSSAVEGPSDHINSYGLVPPVGVSSITPSLPIHPGLITLSVRSTNSVGSSKQNASDISHPLNDSITVTV